MELARFINCSGKEKPCGSCRNCKDIEKGIFPDLVFLQPGENSIQISAVREAIKKLSLKPYSSSMRIAVVDKAHLMTPDAQGCFLKFLEEPKGASLIILITEYPETLLPTIRSRIQKIGFYPVPSQEIKKHLGDKKEAETISLVCGGKPGVALDLLKDPGILDQRKKVVKDLLSLIDGDAAEKFNYAKNLFQNSENKTEEILDIWLRYLRKALLAKAFEKDEGVSLKYSLLELKKIILSIQKTKFLISTTNVNPKLTFEILLMKI